MKLILLFIFLSLQVQGQSLVIKTPSLEIGDMNALLKSALVDKKSMTSKAFDQANIFHDCHQFEDLVINCDIGNVIKANQLITLEYLSGDDPVGLYRAFLFVFFQGTQMINKVAVEVDFRFSRLEAGGYELRLEHAAFVDRSFSFKDNLNQ